MITMSRNLCYNNIKYTFNFFQMNILQEKLMQEAVEFMNEIRLEKYCKDTEYDCVYLEEVEEEDLNKVPN